MLGSSFVSHIAKNRQMIDQRIKAARRSKLIKSRIINARKDTETHEEEEDTCYYDYTDDYTDEPPDVVEKPEVVEDPFAQPDETQDDYEYEEEEETHTTPPVIRFTPTFLNTKTHKKSQEVQDAQENMTRITGLYPTEDENTGHKPGMTHTRQLEMLANWVNDELESMGAGFMLEDAKNFSKAHSKTWEDWATASLDTYTKFSSLRASKARTRNRHLTEGFEAGLNTPFYLSEVRMTLCSEDAIIKFFTDVHTFSVDREDYRQLLEVYADTLETPDEDAQKQAMDSVREVIESACIDPSYTLAGNLFAPPTDTMYTCNAAPVWRLSVSQDTLFEYQNLLHVATILASTLSSHYTGEDVRSGVFCTGNSVSFVVCAGQPCGCRWYLSRCASFVDLAMFAVEQLDGVDVEITGLLDFEGVLEHTELDDPAHIPACTHISKIVEDFTAKFDTAEHEPDTDADGNIYKLRYLVTKFITDNDIQ